MSSVFSSALPASESVFPLRVSATIFFSAVDIFPGKYCLKKNPASHNTARPNTIHGT